MRTLALVLLSGLLAACGRGAANGARTSVAAAIYPLAFAAEAVGGDLVDVELVTPAGVEPHDLEPAVSQVVTLQEADLALLVSEDFQPGLADAAESSRRVLFATELVAPRPGLEDDPHFWLDPLSVASFARGVQSALEDIDPENAQAYRDNFDALRERLNELDSSYEERLADCERRELVTAHDAFGYLASRYGLESVPVTGIDPETEPSPRRIAEVADLVRSSGAEVVFAEELLPARTAETIAAEAGAEVRVLSPLEGAPESGDYFDAMERNLALIAEGLGCK